MSAGGTRAALGPGGFYLPCAEPEPGCTLLRTRALCRRTAPLPRPAVPRGGRSPELSWPRAQTLPQITPRGGHVSRWPCTRLAGSGKTAVHRVPAPPPPASAPREQFTGASNGSAPPRKPPEAQSERDTARVFPATLFITGALRSFLRLVMAAPPHPRARGSHGNSAPERKAEGRREPGASRPQGWA